MSLKQLLSDFNENTILGVNDTRLDKTNVLNLFGKNSTKIVVFRCYRNMTETKNTKGGVLCYLFQKRSLPKKEMTSVQSATTLTAFGYNWKFPLIRRAGRKKLTNNSYNPNP